MLASSGRILLRTATGVGGRTALKALTARVSTSSFGVTNASKPAAPSVSKPFFSQFASKSTVASSELKERDLYDVSKTFTGPDACKVVGIDKLGITEVPTIYRNLTYQELFDHEVANGEGWVAAAEYGDTFAIDTGKFTGRSPKDKWLVLNKGSESEKNVDWNNINQATTPEVFEELYEKAIKYFNTKEKAYVFDCFCGANPKTQKKIRFVHEMAWQQHFVSNMFIRPSSQEDLDNFGEPDFTVINACSQVDEDWERHNLHSDVAVVFNIEEKKAVIFGTWYGGENKKGIFSLMNYWLPMHDPPQFPMHCSANVGKNGDSALFFGLSGTGKTTLSADPHRALIGDDEHGWDEDGIFNFEGGCYAKTINLTEKTEPDIYRAIRTDALLENVKLNEADGKLIPDYFDTTKTENGRVSYPIFNIDGYHKPQMAGHPNHIIFLTCDAFGILPPVAKLSSGQAMYHFISGYTAKVAGTERGIIEPTPNFSACFGAAFLSLHPTRYADLLQQKIEKHGSHAWLVNTGWSGGAYGVGERMSIKTTRSCIDAILDGSAEEAPTVKDEIFGFDVPTSLPNVDPKVLDPKQSWEDPDEYDASAKKLAGMFIKNFEKYADKGSTDYTQFGPKM
uniref:phosphoenolpyruvate carboxykinase (ATP) n=1 Tax=Trieres chinensis TaxID=1514140 RepID=A0A7S1ZHZ9_TRICV|eukprot:CAMPEP_0183300864 /NCGR_PEP_ID=MMETSP0160_2-20130417/7145_1 /TAXON_ID=2839 ORGANISM="Odontella Sinensis, Strain Grunow 1884" /NCGR_SAMPLE_ID=MMETSP0160_2 /ASSEMBLY_ACC=CAM_ASM_000250 /LENGTH=621 /DNA_ID=CAMNT_0025463357 /DNA_START=68 /DNA_END=1933 /DNA_ORIENTATION=-